MKIIKYILIILTSVGLSKTFAQENIRSITLKEACQLAVDSNLEVLNSQFEVQKTHQAVHESQSKLYPHLHAYSNLNYYYAIPKMIMPGEFFGESGDVAVEIGTKYDWSNGVSASFPIVNLSYITSVRLAKRMQNISELNLLQKKEEIVYQVWQVYCLCQATQNQINLLQQNMENTNRLLEITQNQVNNGTARKTDYTKVVVNKNNLQTDIDDLIRLQEQQLNLLRFLTGVDFNTKINLTTQLESPVTSLDNAIPDLHLTSDVLLLDKQITVASLNQKVIGQEYLPGLNLQCEYYYQGQQNSFNFFEGSDRFFKVGYVGFNFNIPVFDGFEKHSKIQQYKIEQEQLKLTKENIIRKLHKDYLDAIKQYNNSIKAVTRQKENVQIAREDYNTSLSQYNEQVLSLAELMLSENALTEARLSYIDGLLQLKNAELEIKKLNGELLKL